jgi:hypothetical protein
MRKANFQITIIASLVICILWIPVKAQTQEWVFARLDQLQAKIKLLENSQEKEIKKLQQQLAAIQPGPATTQNFDSTILALGTQVQGLTQELGTVKAKKTEDAVLLADLTTDLNSLLGELRANLSNPPVTITPIPTEPAAPGIIPGLEFSGFVDASSYYHVPSGQNTFGLDQVELDLEKKIGEIGHVRADVECLNDGAGGFALSPEQGYLYFSPKALAPWGLTLGKFNAPIGFEALDPTGMYQYSWSNIFRYGLPTNVTGAMVSADFKLGINLKAYLCNGWDQNTDINTGKTGGMRLGYTYGAIGQVGMSIISGSQNTSEGDRLSVFDIDLTSTPVSGLTVGGEFNYGNDKIGSITNRWLGFLLMGHYDYSTWGGLTLRYDYFDDREGTRLPSGVAEKRHALTLAPTFVWGQGMGALLEYRLDLSNHQVFLDHDQNPVKTNSAIAFEITYTL